MSREFDQRTGDIITRIQPMNPAIQFQTQCIVIRTRSFLDFVTLGKWRRTVTLDFSQGIVEEEVIRFSKTTVRSHDLRTFDAVDYSYKLLNFASQHGVDHEHEEFSVGMRFKSTRTVFPLASFRGSVATPTGLADLLASVFPVSWNAPNIRHEVEARSLANLLCDKLNLKLAD
jgi:hypothetical protein